MTSLTMEILHENALYFIGETPAVVKQQWEEDIGQMYRFDDTFKGEPMPLRFKVLLEEEESVMSHTLNLCVPRNYIGQPDNAVIHMVMRSFVEIFGDALVGIIHFQNETTGCMDHPKLQVFKSKPVFKKNVNMLAAEVLLRANGVYKEFESLYALEFKDKDRKDPTTLISCTEIYCDRRLTTNKGFAEQVFTVPMSEMFNTPGPKENHMYIVKQIESLQELVASQIQASLEGPIKFTSSFVFEEISG